MAVAPTPTILTSGGDYKQMSPNMVKGPPEATSHPIWEYLFLIYNSPFIVRMEGSLSRFLLREELAL